MTSWLTLLLVMEHEDGNNDPLPHVTLVRSKRNPEKSNHTQLHGRALTNYSFDVCVCDNFCAQARQDSHQHIDVAYSTVACFFFLPAR